MKPLRHGSLFSGIGAAEIAAEMLGWENVFHCEINPFGRKVLEYWFPNSDSYEDITKTDFLQYRGQIDILTGGFPCQPFSYAGKRGGQEDDRYLWNEMLKVIDQVRPMWVIGENVNGITTMVESFEVTEVGSECSLFDKGNGIHRYKSTQTFTIERICRDLESKGYSVQPMLIPACSVAAPHRRDRIFILAYNVADSDCDRRNEVHEHIQSELSDGTESFCNGGKRNVADTKNLFINGSETRYRGNDLKKKVSEPGSGNSQDAADTKCKGLQEWMSIRLCENREEEEARVDNRTERFGYNGRTTRMLPGERWKGFPSVSPVHRGNDGLPFDVDNLTIPFGKWRTESLKAYGNAIVPQVIYQIMKVINDISTNN